MKIWSVEEEAENLRARFQGVNRAAFARDHHVKGGQAMIYQHITGRRPMNLEAATAYAAGFGCSLGEISPRLAAEAGRAAALSAEMPPVEAQASAWPFPEIPEDQVRALPSTQLNALQGAMALAIAQMKLGITVSKPAPPTPSPHARGSLVDMDAADDPFPMRIKGLPPPPWEGGKTTKQIERADQGLLISQAVDVGHVPDSGYSANDQEFLPVPELDVRLAAGTLGIENYQETEIGQILLRRSFLESFGLPIERMRIVYSDGDSMEPAIRHRNPMLLYIDRVEDPLRINPKIVYAINQGGSMIVKCIRRARDGTWLAKSLNPAYSPFPLAKDDGRDVNIVGRILWSPNDLRNGVDERLLRP
jgi:hypothetical protein